MTRRARTLWIRGVVATATTLAALTGVIGYAHTPGGRFLLGYLPGAGACPVGPASPEQVDRARARGLQRVRGAELASARPALGFDLQRMQRADVEAWATRHQVRCEAASALTTTCAAVPARALAGATHDVDQLHLTHDASGALVGVEAMRRSLDFGEAVALVDERLEALNRATGGRAERSGSTTGEHLGGGVARRARGELRFADFRAVVTAMNQGGATPVVRERYQSIPN